MESETVTEYVFLRDVQPGMTILVSEHRDGNAFEGWFIVTDRMDSERTPFNWLSYSTAVASPKPHINLIGKYEDGTPGRTEGRPSNSYLMRVIAE